MTPAPTPPSPPPKRSDRPADNPLRSLLVLIFRLLLLGVGGTIAGLLGILAAQLYPAPRSEEPPLLEQFLQRTNDLRGTLEPVPVTEASSPAASAPPLPTPALRPLNPTERQQVQTEVAALQTQLASLGDRTTALETRVGLPRSTAGIESRLQAIAQQLQPAAASPTAAVPAVLPPAPDPDRLGVTLPIDALFTGESLRSESQILLNTVIGELQRYPNSAILVAAHSDAADNAAQARARSFAQAQAIVRSLEATLGDSYHWVAVGYGQTQPIAPNDTAANRQRNRRIEIGIFPRE
ncbi:OmpA family protein [Microcoleus sp. FACHB-1515]|uniref:OmpA family protein n=1 Tax=Cyanophyceae TaxID=3028117 RepID=UPI00168577C4|nr:OmpA family protein [Microcoleus sp. FACHB-1515]MBD2091608.1 OmpA family protein [Microcoleus sp. FACHB-1515]